MYTGRPSRAWRLEAEIWRANPAKAVEPWIDVSRIKLWIETCKRFHGDHCGYHSSGIRPSEFRVAQWPKWLVDVEQECIVPACLGDVYIALSYVWGGVTKVTTTKENLKYVRQPGFLSSQSAKRAALPQTLRHAMKLAQLLDIRLIWIDSLCIIQNDYEHKHSELQNMASIYANAWMTIIAAHGPNADYGLRGFKEFTSARPSLSGSANGRDEPSIWASRGWTFQEMLFSNRSLFLCDNYAAWQCHCATVDDLEGRSLKPTEGTCNGMRPESRNPIDVAPWPDLQHYAHLVCNYNKRKLTFQQDVLSAFAGIATSFSRVFMSGFICGLPIDFFDVCLLWQPLRPLKRRIPSAASQDSLPLPSWSWVGWEGELDSLSWESGYDYVKLADWSYPKVERQRFWRHDSPWTTRPIVNWTATNAEKNKSVEIVSAVCTQYESVDENSQLPSGWQCHDLLVRPQVLGSASKHPSPHKFYTHPSTPRTEFWCPVPVAASLTATANPQPDLPYLEFSTQHATFKFGEQASTNLPHECCEVAVTLDGTWAGYLRLNQRPTLKWKPGGECELIAISAGSVRNIWTLQELPFENELLPKEKNVFRRMMERDVSRSEQVYEFYNVLWVEHKGNISYRKALGRVAKDVWDRELREMVHVVLG